MYPDIQECSPGRDVCTNALPMSTSAPTRVLAVCLGNICRSPMAEGLLRHHVQTKGLRIKVDSAGTNGYHNGEAPDSRAQAEMRRHDIEIAAQESRQIRKKDFEKYQEVNIKKHGPRNRRRGVETFANICDCRPKIAFENKSLLHLKLGHLTSFNF